MKGFLKICNGNYLTSIKLGNFQISRLQFKKTFVSKMEERMQKVCTASFIMKSGTVIQKWPSVRNQNLPISSQNVIRNTTTTGKHFQDFAF